MPVHKAGVIESRQELSIDIPAIRIAQTGNVLDQDEIRGRGLDELGELKQQLLAVIDAFALIERAEGLARRASRVQNPVSLPDPITPAQFGDVDICDVRVLEGAGGVIGLIGVSKTLVVIDPAQHVDTCV